MNAIIYTYQEKLDVENSVTFFRFLSFPNALKKDGEHSVKKERLEDAADRFELGKLMGYRNSHAPEFNNCSIFAKHNKLNLT